MSIKDVKNEIAKLTYAEVRVMAEWFSLWTSVDVDGNVVDQNGESLQPSISPNDMAANIADWVENGDE